MIILTSTLYAHNKQNYDIFVIYYGNDLKKFNRYKKFKLLKKRKGSKFQNFRYFYHKYPHNIDNYEYFFILDDDIIFIIIILIQCLKWQNCILILCSILSENSIISHNLTKHKKDILLTYTNFIEVNTPLFNKIH